MKISQTVTELWSVQESLETRGPNGSDLLTWVFCHDLVKIHLVVIEILSFSCSVLFLVMADGNHLAVPNCKNQNNLMQR